MALKEQVSNVYGVGLRNVGSYQVSGTPWVTGSAIAQNTTQRFEFAYVPKSFTVINTGSKELYLHFHSETTFSGSGATFDEAYASGHGWVTNKHYITLASGDTVTLNTKQRYIFLSEPNNQAGAACEIFAELTNIPVARMYDLSGAGISDGS